MTTGHVAAGSQSRTIVVVYGLGAATPQQIIEACRGVCRISFVFDGSDEHSAAAAPVLRQAGHSIDVSVVGVDDAVSNLRRAGAGAIVTFSQASLPLTWTLADALALPYHSATTLARLVDKTEQRRAFDMAGVPSPSWYPVEDKESAQMAFAAIGGPAVFKPAVGGGSVDTYAVEDRSDLDRIAAETWPDAGDRRRFVLEERMSGSHPSASWLADYISVESVLHEGAARHFCVADKPPLAWPFRETGMILPSTLPTESRRDALDVAEAALAACGIESGATQVELKLTADGPKVIEVNGRLGGSVHRLVSRTSEMRPIRSSVEAAFGIEPRLVPSFRSLSLQYLVPPPPDASVLVSPPDASELRAIPGVYAVDARALAGTRIDWRSGTLSRVCTVWGEAADLNDAKRIFDTADAVIVRSARYE